MKPQSFLLEKESEIDNKVVSFLQVQFSKKT